MDLRWEGQKTSKVNSLKEKNINCTSSKLKCYSVESVLKLEKQVTYWEKIFVNHVLQKRIVSGIYQECSKLKNTKSNPIRI